MSTEYATPAPISPLALEIVQRMDRLFEIERSINGKSADERRAVRQELSRTPVDAPILHWWTGNAEETSRAVKLGCYFSVHSQVARRSQFRMRVPPERILVETDHGYDDPPAAIPCRIEWVEHLTAQQLGIGQMDVRRLVWRNFGVLVHRTGLQGLLPEGLAAHLTASR